MTSVYANYEEFQVVIKLNLDVSVTKVAWIKQYMY